MSKPSSQQKLSSDQVGLLYQDLSLWAKKWAMATLSGQTDVALGARRVSVDTLGEALTQVMQSNLPVYAGDLVGRDLTSLTGSEDLYFRELLAPVCVFTEAALRFTCDGYPPALDAIAAKKLTYEDILRHPYAHLPATFPMLEAAREHLSKVSDLLIPDAMRADPTLRLGPLPADWKDRAVRAGREPKAMNLSTTGYRGAEPSADIRIWVDRLAEELPRDGESANTLSSIGALAAKVTYLSQELGRIQRAQRGEVLSPDEAPLSLPGGTSAKNDLRELTRAHHAESDAQKNAGVTRTILGGAGVFGGATVLATAHLVAPTFGVGAEALNSVFHRLTMLGGGLMAAVGGVGVASGVTSKAKPAAAGDRERQLKNARAEAGRVDKALAAERSGVEHAISTLTDEIGQRAAEHDAALSRPDLGNLKPQDIARAVARRNVLGPAVDQDDRAWPAYAKAVTSMAVARGQSADSAHVVARAPEVREFLREVAPVRRQAEVSDPQLRPGVEPPTQGELNGGGMSML